MSHLIYKCETIDVLNGMYALHYPIHSKFENSIYEWITNIKMQRDRIHQWSAFHTSTP